MSRYKTYEYEAHHDIFELLIIYKYANIEDWYVDDIIIVGMQTIDGDKILLSKEDKVSLIYTIDSKIKDEFSSILQEHLETEHQWLSYY